MNNGKEILFLSPFDFVEKGIQVIFKTPLFYASHGWGVHFLVVRDNSINGSYYYEKIINPKEFKTYRFKMYDSSLLSRLCQSKISKTVYSKLRSYIAIIQLISHGYFLLKDNAEIKILYGYGPVGTLASFILKLIFWRRRLKVVSRYFGITGTNSLIASKFKRVFNWDIFLSLSLPVDACIITNDGTQGDKILKKFFPKRLECLHFWVNGVDEKSIVSEKECNEIKEKYSLDNKIIVLSVSRLAYWKRVDRSIMVIDNLIKKHSDIQIKLLVIGEGADKQRLVELTNSLSLSSHVEFVGAVSNKEISSFYSIAHFFISTYDLSNVGNPLLEAIRFNKIIFTLNNGDTSSWIRHKINGFIYDVNNNLIDAMADDLYKLLIDDKLQASLSASIKETEKKMLWTWEERLSAELDLTNSLVGIGL